jgi:hypothetical protein
MRSSTAWGGRRRPFPQRLDNVALSSMVGIHAGWYVGGSSLAATRTAVLHRGRHLPEHHLIHDAPGWTCVQIFTS